MYKSCKLKTVSIYPSQAFQRLYVKLCGYHPLENIHDKFQRDCRNVSHLEGNKNKLKKNTEILFIKDRMPASVQGCH